MTRSSGHGVARDRAPPPLVASLYALADREDRAALAALRRGLGREPGEEPALYPYVLPYVGSGEGGVRATGFERACFVVAALFGRHPVWRGAEGDLGWTVRRLAAARDASDAIDRRLRAVLASHADELPGHLRQVVSLAASASSPVPIDFARLLHDVCRWSRPRRPVQLRWARSYWREPMAASALAGVRAPPGEAHVRADEPLSGPQP